MVGLSALIGVAAGGAAFVLVKLIALITNVALFGRVAWTLPPSSSIEASPRLVIAAMLGGLVVALLARWAPVIKGHGIPEAMEAVLVRDSRIAPRVALVKPTSAAVAIGTGGPFGAEGPIIVTGGAIGSLCGQVIAVSAAERKVLLSVGAAAGMAATFGAPLAAVVLAIELLLFEFSARALVPLLVGTSVAAGMHAAIFDAGPLFAVPAHPYVGLANLPAFALLGVACGLLAVVICKGLFAFEAGFRHLPIPSFWHPVIGGLGFGLVGLVVPGALGVGYDEISDVLLGRLAIGTVVALLVGKLLAWWIALGSGTSGGTLAPILLISGCFGSLFADVLNHAVPQVHASPTTFALVAMAATFGAATRTPLTSIVFAFELTQDYQVV
jgi:H+/Cl- antiporter ClcA